MRFILLFVVIIFSFANNIKAQQIIDDSLVSGGINRTYKLYIPITYNPSTPTALVINMHGLGSNSLQQMFYGNFTNLANVDGFIVVHPQGTINPITNQAYWNAHANGSVNDIQFISDLIDTISSNYNIDSNCVHATGMSNGGFMSISLACELQSKIASVASVTGTMLRTFPASCPNANSISIMQIQGTNDSTVPYNGNIAMHSVNNVINFWTNHNQTSNTPIIDSLPNINTSDGSTAIKYTYGNGNQNTEVIHYKVVGGEHTWPGASFNIGVTNQDFNASSVIWEFFKKHKRNSSTSSIIENLNDDNIEFHVYQNNIEIFNPSKSKMDVSIHNYMGQLLFHKQYSEELNNINTESLNNGIYIMNVIDTKTNIRRVLKFKR